MRSSLRVNTIKARFRRETGPSIFHKESVEIFDVRYMRKMEKFHHIYVPIFKDNLYIFFGSTKDCCEAMYEHGLDQKYRDWFYGDKSDSKYLNGSFIQIFKYEFNMIWIPKFPKSGTELANLIHEIEHATHRILTDHGIRHTEDTDEVYAYLQGWITKQILEFIDDFKKQK